MTRKLEQAIRRAIRDKEVGALRKMEIEAYVIGAYSDDPEEDVDLGCDAKVPLAELEVKPGDRIDCYVYGAADRDWDDVELVTNIEVAFGEGLEITEVLSVEEVARREHRDEEGA